MDAERDIAKANPPEGRGLAVDKNSVPQGNTKNSGNAIRKMRMAHDNLSDTEYSEIKSEAADNEEPLKKKV